MPPEPMFPISVHLQNQPCLVLGGGEIALTKTRALLAAGAEVHIVSAQLNNCLAILIADGRVLYAGKHLRGRLVRHARIAIDSGEEPAISPRLRTLCHRHGRLLNSVDNPEHCDFHIPAVVKRGPIQVAISTGGAAPTLARNIRQKLEHLLPKGLEHLVRHAARIRPHVKKALQPDQQRLFWNRLFDSESITRLALEDQNQTVKRVNEALIDAEMPDPMEGATQGSVHLVGAGAGSADMITLRGLRALESADAVLYDALVDDHLLTHARRDARLIAVGKRCGKHSSSQEFINRTLMNLARAGKQVVRLKCGDPFIFGRGGEELEFLQSAGIHTTVIPGVTAASVAAAEAGVPLTHRGIARRVTFMTGMTNAALAKDRADWNALLAGGTVALYMSRRRLTKLLAEMLAAGLPPDLPLVAVAHAGTASQTILRATIRLSDARIEQIPLNAPTLVIIGRAAEEKQHSSVEIMNATQGMSKVAHAKF